MSKYLQVALNIHLAQFDFDIVAAAELAPQHLLGLPEGGLLGLEDARQPLKQQLLASDDLLPHLLEELPNLVPLSPSLSFRLP